MLWTLNFSNARSLSNVGWNVVVVAFYVNWQNAWIDDDRRWFNAEKICSSSGVVREVWDSIENFSWYRKNIGRFRWLFFPIYFFILFLKCKWIHHRIGLYEDATIIRICMMAWQCRRSTQTWVDEFMMKILERRRDVFAARSKLSTQCEEKKIEIHFDFNLKFLSLWARSSPGVFQNTNEQVCTHETKLIQINATIVNDDRFVMENIFS